MSMREQQLAKQRKCMAVSRNDSYLVMCLNLAHFLKLSVLFAVLLTLLTLCYTWPTVNILHMAYSLNSKCHTY